MPLSDSDRARLRRGQVVWLSDVINSFGNNAAGPHRAILLDTNDAIAEALEGEEVLFVSIISTKEYEPKYLEPVPARLKVCGICGNSICDWCEPVHVRQIDRLIPGAVLFEPELLRILVKYRQFLADKHSKKTGDQSTQS